jgi:hypothetical protein
MGVFNSSQELDSRFIQVLSVRREAYGLVVRERDGILIRDPLAMPNPKRPRAFAGSVSTFSSKADRNRNGAGWILEAFDETYRTG